MIRSVFNIMYEHLLNSNLNHWRRVSFINRARVKRLLFVFALAGFSACSVSTLRDDPKAGNFEVGKLSDHWKRLPKEQSDDADQVYENTKSGAFLSVDSVCGRYPDSTLESLTNQLIVPLHDIEIVNEKKITINDREALARDVKGKIDGVAVESKLVVLRKNTCIFDFTMHSKGHVSESDAKDFDTFVQGFRYE